MSYIEMLSDEVMLVVFLSEAEVENVLNEVLDRAKESEDLGVAINFENVSTISEVELEMLLKIQKALDGELVLFSVNEAIKDLFKNAELDRVFKIADFQTTALMNLFF